MANIPKVVALFETSLQAKINSSATSMTLVSGTDKAGNTLSGVYGMVIDEGSSNEEFIIGTVAGTAVTSMLRGVSPADAKTEVAALKKEHRRGASVKITDFPVLGVLSRMLNGDETIPNKLQYTSEPTLSDRKDIVSLGFVQDTAIAGGVDASTTVKGISKLSVAPASATEPIAAGTNDTRIPSQDENDALAGTSGTPSSTNKYVTNDDTAENTASKLVRRKSDSNITVPSTPTADTDASSKLFVQNSITNALSTTTYVVSASDNLKYSLDTERTNTSYTSAAILTKSFRVFKYGTYRVKFDGKKSTSTGTPTARIYKNGVAFGTLQSLTLSYTTYSEDLIFSPNDTIELWTDSTSGPDNSAVIKNFRLYFDRTQVDDGITITDINT